MNTERLREILRTELALARMQTDQLFQMLVPAALHERPIPERHRIIFYLGHLEAFDWNMICAISFGMSSFNSQFDRLFEFGIDPIDGTLPQDKPSDWPRVDEILSYRDRVRSTVDGFLGRSTFESTSQPFVGNGQIFHVAIEHRLMHAETLAYMFHWLPYDMKVGQRGQPPLARRESSSLSDVAQRNGKAPIFIPAGDATLGQPTNDAASFGWDNEFQAHTVTVPEFSIDAFNVTNEDFLEFVHARAYAQRSLWSDEGWQWIQQAGIEHPKFWLRRGSEWFYRAMFEEIPLPPNWPVYVSQAEASAYARWKGKALPTEPQYHRAAFGAPDRSSRSPLPGGNFNFQSWEPVPVGTSVGSRSPFGAFDLAGNGWEWTSTPFSPFEGFQRFSFYPGYSADFFDGKHFVLKGASPRTAALLVRPSFRNWFQPYYPNIYATFRCVGN